MKIAVLTSGGDCPGMNAAISGVVNYAESVGIEVYGIERGYRGLYYGLIRRITKEDVFGIERKGGSVLKSARFPEFEFDRDIRKTAIDNLTELGITGLVAIGGNGTFAGAQVLCNEAAQFNYTVSTVGIPATIDNDLSFTDFTLGFDTALNTVVESIDKIRDTAESHNRVTVVEMMGNKCGDLTLYGGICSAADIVITKERTVKMPEIIDRIRASVEMVDSRHSQTNRKTGFIIALSEKVCGTADDYVKIIDPILNPDPKNKMYDVRGSVLGYIQRGGNPTANDRLLGIRLGVKAVQVLETGEKNLVVGIKNNKVIVKKINEVFTIDKNGKIIMKPRPKNKELYAASDIFK